MPASPHHNMVKKTRREESMQEGTSLKALLAQPIDHRLTRHILEIRFPTLLYLFVDERERYRLIGRPGLSGGHFQLGRFNANRKEWQPVANQDELIWESMQERDCILHRIHRQYYSGLFLALIQHSPTYTKHHDIQALESIDLVEVSPLWDTKLAGHTITCSLLAPCGCPIYQQLLTTKNFQWQL
jgi:hypothetical protein